MPDQLFVIFVALTILIVFSPVYLQRNKLWRMADEDLKRIDYTDWKKQVRANAFIRLGNRVIWGLLILSGFIYPHYIAHLRFDWLAVIVSALGISFIVWGILRFRSEMKMLKEIDFTEREL